MSSERIYLLTGGWQITSWLTAASTRVNLLCLVCGRRQ